MKLLMSACEVVASLTIVFTAMGQDQEESKKELGKLQGAWRVVSSQVGDEKAPPDEMKELEGKWIAVAVQSGGKRVEGKAFKKTDLGETLVIRDGSIRTINKEGKELKSRMTIDPTKTPKTLDRVFMIDGKELVVRSVYTLDDDILRLCTGMENVHVRPKSFTQDGTYVVTYKRQAALKVQPERK